MAYAFYMYPDTEWTKPDMMPKTWPGSLYTWAVGKIIFLGSYVLLPTTFLGHPLNYTLFDELDKFTSDNFSSISSEDTAMIFIFTWMALPYIVPFAWANNFYLWYLQIPLEFHLWAEYMFHL